MIRSRVVHAAVLCGLAILPAAAADRPGIYVESYAKWAPYYLVNQGPEISGPGIVVTAIGYTRTHLRRSYPYIVTYDDRTRYVATTDYYGALPATLDPAVRVPPRSRPSSRRKPIRSRY